MKGHADREEAIYRKTHRGEGLEESGLGSPGLNIPPEDITERIPAHELSGELSTEEAVNFPGPSSAFDRKPLLRSSSAGTPIAMATPSSLETDMSGAMSEEEGMGKRKDSKKKGKNSGKAASKKRYRTDQERMNKERERRNANNQRERYVSLSPSSYYRASR
jgi:hypothetical protein